MGGAPPLVDPGGPSHGRVAGWLERGDVLAVSSSLLSDNSLYPSPMAGRFRGKRRSWTQRRRFAKSPCLFFSLFEGGGALGDILAFSTPTEQGTTHNMTRSIIDGACKGTGPAPPRRGARALASAVDDAAPPAASQETGRRPVRRRSRGLLHKGIARQSTYTSLNTLCRHEFTRQASGRSSEHR